MAGINHCGKRVQRGPRLLVVSGTRPRPERALGVRGARTLRCWRARGLSGIPAVRREGARTSCAQEVCRLREMPGQSTIRLTLGLSWASCHGCVALPLPHRYQTELSRMFL